MKHLSESTVINGVSEVPCPLCGIKFATEHFAESGCWKYAACANCGAVFLRPSPSPEDLRTYYNQAYMVPVEAYARGTRRNAPPLLKKLAERLPAKGKLLEIGCSYGFFLEAARQEGWDVAGIELDEEAARHGREKLGLKVFSGTLESELPRLEPPYQAIATFHVIEHVADPIRFLRHCRELLGEQGVLIMKTPNVASWIARRTGSCWQWLSAPAHIHLFSPEALELTLAKSGFRVEKIWSRRGDAHNNLFELACAAGRYLATRKEHKAAGVNGRKSWCDSWQVNAARAAAEAMYCPLGMVVDPWLERKGLQPELVAIARA